MFYIVFCKYVLKAEPLGSTVHPITKIALMLIQTLVLESFFNLMCGDLIKVVDKQWHLESNLPQTVFSLYYEQL